MVNISSYTHKTCFRNVVRDRDQNALRRRVKVIQEALCLKREGTVEKCSLSPCLHNTLTLTPKKGSVGVTSELKICVCLIPVG